MDKLLENILEIRNKLGYSQEYMASKLNIKQAGYGLIENGKRELKFSTLQQIAMIFNMDVVDLIKYPEKYVNNKEVTNNSSDVKAVLQIELAQDKKDQVLKLVFGENNLEILTR